MATPLLAVAAAALLGATAPAHGRATATCAARSLRYETIRIEGAAGTFLISLRVRTTGARCELYGYPKLQIIGRTGPLPTHVRHGGLAILNRPARRVVLAQTRPAKLLVAYNAVPSGSETSCPRGVALAVDGVRVRVATRACRGSLRESPYVAA
jgi:hypothetical protein